MRIAMVGPFGFHPKKTMRSRALPLAKALVDRGHDLFMLMPPWHTPAEAGRQWVEDGVSIKFCSLKGGLPGTTARMIRESLAWQPDVVHTFKPKAYSGLVGWWLWQFRRQRITLVTDTDDWEGAGGWNDISGYSRIQRIFFSWQERWGYKHNHALTVASRTLERIALEMDVAQDRLLYLPNGPGIQQASSDRQQIREKLELNQNPTLLLYSRLFEFEKSRLFTILDGVKSAVPDLKILGVGTGLHQQEALEFKQLLAGSALKSAFVDVGWQEEATLPGFLAAADVGLYLMEDTLLNRAKCPVKLADMLWMGLPVVGEAIGQVPEYVVDGESGLLRRSGDNQGVIADLIRLLGDSNLRKRLGSGARQHIYSNFRWSLQAMRVEKLYHDCQVN